MIDPMRPDGRKLVEGAAGEKDRQQTSDEASDDPEQDGGQNPHRVSAGHERPGNKPGDQPNDEEPNNCHNPSVRWTVDQTR